MKIAGHVFVLPSSERTMPVNVTYHGIVLVAMVNIYNGSIHDKYRQVTKGVRNLSFHIGGKSRVGGYWLTLQYPNGVTINALYKRTDNYPDFTSQVTEKIRIFDRIDVSIYHVDGQGIGFIPLAPSGSVYNSINLHDFFGLPPGSSLRTDFVVV